jgi:hypothetical protein
VGRYWLWLWPLPPADTFQLVAEWPAAGLTETFIEIEGAAISEIAGHALGYWK